MKLALFTQNLAPFRMKWMNELGKQCDVVVYHLNQYEKDVPSGYINYIPQNARVKDIGRPFGKGVVYDLKQAEELNGRILILDGYGFLGQQLLILYLHLHRMPFLLSVDGGFVPQKELVFKKWVKSFFIRKAAAYFSTSEQTDAFLRHYARQNPILFRHRFSSLSREDLIKEPLSEAEKRKWKKELGMKDAYTILAVGKFIPIKGFDVLLRALADIKGGYQLYLIGSKEKKRYEGDMEPSVRERTHFIDFCEKDTLRKYYMASDVFVLPTRRDVWGLVILEAMAHGLEVITTRQCLAGAALLPERYLVPADDSARLSAKIKEVMDEGPEIRFQNRTRNLAAIEPYAIEHAAQEDLGSLQQFWEMMR